MGARSISGPSKRVRPTFAQMTLSAGLRVRIRSAFRPDFNSQEGWLEKFEEDGRWVLQCDSGEAVRVRPANLEACEPPLSVPFGPRLLTDAPLLFDTKAVALDYARNMPHAGGRMGPDTDLNVGALMVPFDMMLIKTAHNFCVYTPCDHVLITHEAFIFSEFANEGTSDDSRRVVVMLQAPGDDGKVRLSGSIKPYTYDQPNAPPILHGVVPTSKPSENTTLMRIALSVVVSKKFLVLPVDWPTAMNRTQHREWASSTRSACSSSSRRLVRTRPPRVGRSATKTVQLACVWH